MGDVTAPAPFRVAPADRARQAVGHYGLLLVATLTSLAVQGMVRPGGVQTVVVTALAAVSLLLAFRAARLPPRAIGAAAAFGALAIVVALIQALAGGIGEGAVRLTNAALVALGPPAVAIGVIRDLRASGQVRIEAVMGVLAFYILVGMTFGFVYGAVDRLGGAPFFADGTAATVSNCLYFSFITLATVGFGDLVPRSDVGHTLAVFEALIGQIYLVTVVSLIVSNLGRPARPRLRPDD